MEDEGLAVRDEKESVEERLGADTPPELEAKTKEGLLLPNGDVVEEPWLNISELAVLKVKLVDDIVLTNPGGGGGGTTAGLVTVVVVAGVEPKGIVEVLVKVKVVDIELVPGLGLGNVVADDITPLGIVGVSVVPDTVL
ncbi:hypothetical protein PMIN05_010609 [Paraphaeosphaeria minitans]